MSNISQREDQIVVITPPTPWITLMLVLMCIFGFYLSQASGEHWLKDNAFNCEKYFQQDNIIAQINYCVLPTFCQINILHMIGSAYFIWIFGSQIELRVGNALMAVIVMITMISGWMSLAQTLGPIGLPVFVGPAFLTCALLGGYLMLMPGKKTNPMGGNSRYTYRIFARETKMDPLEHFGISPWFLIIGGVAFLVLMHLYLEKTGSVFDVLRLLPCLVSLIIGLVVTSVLVMMITQSVETNPMRALARNRYKELRILDMTHEMAVQGTALALGVPKEKVEEWLGTGAKL
ncbi:MAG: rhomboid family intramembrane serine protease [Candidatus Obscuribacterales bacterium]|nr:rhomboid family intramembrane serine protease [Candidatus Obscuribacterales bacterium]